jgi:putative FmdB family regulatory protein
MITYEYFCKSCGHFEFDQKITDEALSKCPKCNDEVKRLISKGIGFQLVGSGWFKSGGY